MWGIGVEIKESALLHLPAEGLEALKVTHQCGLETGDIDNALGAE